MSPIQSPEAGGRKRELQMQRTDAARSCELSVMCMEANARVLQGILISAGDSPESSKALADLSKQIRAHWTALARYRVFHHLSARRQFPGSSDYEYDYAQAVDHALDASFETSSFKLERGWRRQHQDLERAWRKSIALVSSYA